MSENITCLLTRVGSYTAALKSIGETQNGLDELCESLTDQEDMLLGPVNHGDGAIISAESGYMAISAVRQYCGILEAHFRSSIALAAAGAPLGGTPECTAIVWTNDTWRELAVCLQCAARAAIKGSGPQPAPVEARLLELLRKAGVSTGVGE